MKKAYTVPETYTVAIENETNLMSASFDGAGNGNVGKDDEGGYEGGDALGREEGKTAPNLWEQGW